METTPGSRLRYLRELLGFKGQQQDFADKIGLTQQSVSNMERDKTEPAAKSLNKIYAAFPQVNIGWLVSGAGEPLDTIRTGRALTPAPRAAEPAADYTSGGSTEQTLYISVLKEQVADLKADKTRLLGENDKLSSQVSELLGKPFDSSDAAGLSDEVPTDPHAPTFAGGAAPLPRLRVQGLVRYAEEAAELS